MLVNMQVIENTRRNHFEIMFFMIISSSVNVLTIWNLEGLFYQNNFYWVLLLLTASMTSIPSEWETVWIRICGGSDKRLFVPSKTLNLYDFM